ncbi:MAG: EAL domain-containing protein [Candidatus Sumerlaeaceae bacterium]
MAQQQTNWYLEGALTEDGPVTRFNVREKPVMVGRQAGMDLVLRNDGVSRRHAQLYVEGDCLWIRDLGSSNGTFVNRQRISEPTALRAGDVVHFAGIEFIVGCDENIHSSSGLDTLAMSSILPENYPTVSARLVEMIRDVRVHCHYEPIVMAGTQQVWAYEALGRGALDGLPESPLELFALAAPLGLQAELSRVFRTVSIREVPSLTPEGGLFLNIHPAEMEDTATLVASLRAVRSLAPSLPLVVEIPEMLVTNDAALSALRERLGELNIQLAYDDFGAGQARLVELTRVPPEYLKFDKVLVGDLAKPGLRVRTILEMLITFAHDLGVKCVAEGVASHEVAAAACDVGFDLLQGHFFSKASALSTVTPLQPFG